MLGKAVALQKLGLGNSAQETYEELLAIDPGNRAAMSNLLALTASAQPQQALAQLERLEASNPASAPILAQIGMLHAQLGDGVKAAQQMQRATALAPENPIYKLNLAILYDRAGRSGEALRLYQEVLSRTADTTQQMPMALDDVRRRVAYLGSVN
jgi:Flp pilus assembly protein TadD